MKKIIRYCVNPKCTTGKDKDMRPTSITPVNALYKPEGGGSNACLFAPKTFLGKYRWPKKFLYKEKDNNVGTRTYNVNVERVYCPSCNEPINVECDPIRIAIIGPTNCGKTVFLTVLNDMLTKRSEVQPMYFEKIGGRGNFSFTQEGNKFYLPEATDTKSFDYMIYDCLRNTGSASIFDYVNQNNGDKNSKENKIRNNIELAFYDLSGEYFQEGVIQKAEDRNIKLAQLDHADLVLVVIDCNTIFGKNKSREDFSFSQFIRNFVKTIKQRNDRNLSCAICYLASDTLDPEMYGDSFGNSINLRMDERFYTSDGFDMEKCNRHIDKVYRAFVTDSKHSNPAILELVNEGTFIPGETLGLFAVSAIGPQEIKYETDESNSKAGKPYITDYNSVYGWNVLAPIHWFLSRKGYIKTKAENK